MKKPLFFLLLGIALGSMGCAVGADEDTVISDESVDGSGQAVGNDRGLDAANGDEIQDTRASSRDQLDDNGIDHLSGDDEEGPDPTPWEDEEDEDEGHGHDGGEREGPDPTPWMRTTGPDPTPWQGSESDDDEGSGSGTWTTTDEEEEPDPQPWSTRSASSGSSED